MGNEEFVFVEPKKISDWWSSDCSPWKYGGKCAWFTFGLIVCVGWLGAALATDPTAEDVFWSDTVSGRYFVSLIVFGVVGGIGTFINTSLFTWLLRRGTWRIFRSIEQSLFWWSPPLTLISFLSWQHGWGY